MAASETPASQEAEAFQMPTLDSAGLQIRQDRGNKGYCPPGSKMLASHYYPRAMPPVTHSNGFQP